ncbi:hypothetical protein C0Q70_16638 [Pomacea canaliculata]|uniref:Uncharacterized protein n=1 Tax=Pomacea canaliculata TaxID=400727 RepID=A0A2T7NQC0_POMCA|nr:hypothetical protein C0Q70_16638 [Pomacea canaliculata]
MYVQYVAAVVSDVQLSISFSFLIFFCADSVFGDQQSSTPINMAATTQPPEVPDGACALSPRNATTPNKSPTPDKVVESKGHPERKRRASNESEDVGEVCCPR